MELTYLGSTISCNGCIDDEIQRRMGKTSALFGRLRQKLWNNHHTYASMRVKGKIYRAIVLSKVTNKDILERKRLPSMEDLLIRKNLRLTGHLMRMSPDRLPKQVLYSHVSSGHRKRGRVSGTRIPSSEILKLREIKTDSLTYSHRREINGEQ